MNSTEPTKENPDLSAPAATDEAAAAAAAQEGATPAAEPSVEQRLAELESKHAEMADAFLRAGASDTDLAGLITSTWQGRTDRGAEQRLGLHDRAPLYQVAGLKGDPHREMHTRGG